MNPFTELQPHEIAQIKPVGTRLLAYRGSIAHGMYTPSTDPESIDDVDLMGVYVLDSNYYLGGKGSDTHSAFVGKYDVVSYEIRKLFGLLLRNNPNVMSLLWLDNNMYLETSKVGKTLIAARELFSSKLAYPSFCGYAHGQISRMANAGVERYKTAYMGSKRKGLVEKFGYDCKNAAHAIRLLRMGSEFLRTGQFNVNRREVGDADELYAIKTGAWPIERVKAEADRMFAQLETAKNESKLPSFPDERQIQKLLIGILSYELHTDVVLKSVEYSSDHI